MANLMMKATWGLDVDSAELRLIVKALADENMTPEEEDAARALAHRFRQLRADGARKAIEHHDRMLGGR